VTHYALGTPSQYSIQSLRLTPPSFDGQQVVSWSIEMPNIDEAVRFRDSFGNIAHLVVMPEPHDDVRIVARGTIDTQDRAGLARGLVEIAPQRVYLRETPRTIPDSAIRELGTAITGDDPVERMHRLMNIVHERVEYVIGATQSNTTAAEALSTGRGVCQDHAHIFVSAARTMGFPARYVNGYFLNYTDDPAEAHHAWGEVWIGGLGWVGFDPANRICPTDHYVRLTWGLDAASAAPIRGTRRGAAQEVLDVSVEVQQQSSQQ
jgi:transglutaminase-like putative cysteine protease